VRLDIRKTGVVKNGDLAMGTKTRVKVVKNKMAPPFREAEFEILYGTGVNWAGEIVDLGSEAGLIEKSGAYYSFGGERIAQGRDNACAYMVENPKTAEIIRAHLIQRRKAENAGAAAPAAPAHDAAA
jgi:recombination protein RecA